MLLVHKHNYPGNWIWNISFSRFHLQIFGGVFGVFLVLFCFLESFKQTVRLPALLFQCSKAFEQFKYAEAILIANQAESQESSDSWISGWIGGRRLDLTIPLNRSGTWGFVNTRSRGVCLKCHVWMVEGWDSSSRLMCALRSPGHCNIPFTAFVLYCQQL